MEVRDGRVNTEMKIKQKRGRIILIRQMCAIQLSAVLSIPVCSRLTFTSALELDTTTQTTRGASGVASLVQPMGQEMHLPSPLFPFSILNPFPFSS